MKQPDPKEVSNDWPFLIGSTVAVVAVLGGSLFAYQRYGGAFVDGLDEQIGELLAARARAAASAGMTEAAIPLFEEALATPFMNEEHRLFSIHDYAALLIEEGRYQTALTWIEEGERAYPDDGKLARLRFELFRNLGRNDDALAAAKRWYAAGMSAGNVTAMRAAKFGEAILYRDMMQLDLALGAFLAAHELVPGPDTAVRAGRLYARRGQHARARKYFEEAAVGIGPDAETARELLEKLPE